MTGKRFKVHTEEYQDTDDMGYAIAPPVIYYHVGNSEIGFNFDTEREAKMLCEAWNKLVEENEQLKQKLKKYEEIEELKKEDFINCHNCKNNRSVHDGVVLDGMCAIKELMNLDGYFDTEYHKLPSGTICPCWELEE